MRPFLFGIGRDGGGCSLAALFFDAAWRFKKLLGTIFNGCFLDGPKGVGQDALNKSCRPQCQNLLDNNKLITASHNKLAD